MTDPSVSVVLPLYRNAAVLAELFERLAASLASEKFEIIGVDDACPEGCGTTFSQIGEKLGITARLIRYPENLGQNRAVLSGMQVARGRHIVVMDADLQDPPEEIPKLLSEARRRGVEVVFGRRTGRYRGGLDSLTSYIFKWILFRLAGCGFDPRVGLFFVLSSEGHKRLTVPNSSPPYVMAILAHARLTWTDVKYVRQERAHGLSAYTFWKRLTLARTAFRCHVSLRKEMAP